MRDRATNRLDVNSSGLAVAALILALTALGCEMAIEGVMVSNAIDEVRAADSPLVGWSYVDSGDARIGLARGLGRREARAVWCEILLPLGLDGSNTMVMSYNYQRKWPAPSTCS